MSLSRTPAAKDYVDRGVQTITSSPPSVKTWTPWLARSLSKTSSSRAEKGSLSGCSSVVSPKSHSHSSTQLDSAYSHSLPPDSPSPVRSAAITRRMHKRQQTPYSRPIQQPNQRVVSLPRDPLYDTKTLLEPTTMRVVSLPDRLPSSFPENSFSSDSISLHTEQSFITRDDRYSRIRRVCSSVDAPHTPSPPSSPDSVLIIDDQDQLSDTFLRRKSISDSQQLFSDDEGWITWATSPPRPIPALHGPLSLPYARCPSGAEGTIIEENDSLPRMIWGLGADDAPSTHSRGSSYNPQHETPRMDFSHNSHFKAPPRLQKKQASSAYLVTPQQTPTLLLDSRRDRKVHDPSDQHVLENIESRYPHDAYVGAITLDNMLSSGSGKVLGTWDSLYGHLAYQPQHSIEGGRAVNMGKGLALDWQSTFTRQSLETSLIKNEYTTKLSNFLKPSAPPFVPSSQITPLSYPRIFVEPRSPQVHQKSSQSRRKAAIDITQRLGYHQKRDYQNVLPTPPSSSSPLWSSTFSPYQGSFHSPDVALSRLSRITDTVTHQKQHNSTDSSSELRKFVYDRISNASLAANTSNTSTTVLQGNQAFKSQTVTPRCPDVSHLVKHIQHLNLSSSSAIKSSPHPGPPPSAPLPPLPPVTCGYQSRVDQLPIANTPPSPTSPESRPCSVSYQNPRSIPLARLVQRRLSSVPEEDPNSFIERVPALLPPPSQQLSGNRRTSHVPQAQSVRQTPGTRSQQKQLIYSAARTPSPLPNALALKLGTPTDVDREELEPDSRYISRAELKAEFLPAKVKLPCNPLTAYRALAKPHGERDKTAKRVNDSLKENLAKGKDASRGNPKKRGRGKKIMTSSTIVTHAYQD